jgi:G:T-mismatch repair DNA endonuclease (very short patch repair protein)
LPKLARNVERDSEHIKALNKKGYRVLRVWEHQLRNREIVSLEKELIKYLVSIGWKGQGPVETPV